MITQMNRKRKPPVPPVALALDEDPEHRKQIALLLGQILSVCDFNYSRIL